MKGLLTFLKKLTLKPDDIATSDVEELRELGISDLDIEDAIEVCVLFNIIVRLADSFNFHVPSDAAFAKMAGPLLKMGYRV